MSFFNRFRRDPTPDEVLIKDLRVACDIYNQAMAKAHNAGIAIVIHSKWSPMSSWTHLLGNYALRVAGATRRTEVKI